LEIEESAARRGDEDEVEDADAVIEENEKLPLRMPRMPPPDEPAVVAATAEEDCWVHQCKVGSVGLSIHSLEWRSRKSSGESSESDAGCTLIVCRSSAAPVTKGFPSTDVLSSSA
jgi:hypothetical protein